MKIPFGILLAPLCVFALGTHPISSPVDFMDNNLPLLNGLELPDSTWVVADFELTLWFSRDHGANWESLPFDSLDTPGEIVGSAVVSADRLSTWSFAGGWVPMRLPTSYTASEDSYFGTRGDRGFLDDIDGRIRYYRSTDRMKSWVDWFSMDASLVPSGSSTYGEMEVGKIWYLVADSGYIRGTANGTSWTKSVLPKDFEPSEFEPDDADTALQLIGYVGTDLVVARSGNLGSTWRIQPLSAPGDRVRRLSQSIWSSSTISGTEPTPDLWLSRSPSGPWSRVDASGINAIFPAAGAILVATATGLEQVELSFSPIAPRVSPPTPEIRRIGSRLAILAKESLAGSRWQIVTSTGAQIGTGRLQEGLNLLPCPKGSAWIRFGKVVLAVPRF